MAEDITLDMEVTVAGMAWEGECPVAAVFVRLACERSSCCCLSWLPSPSLCLGCRGDRYELVDSFAIVCFEPYFPAEMVLLCCRGYGGYSGYSGYGGYGGGYGGGFMGGGYMGMPPMGGGAWLQNFHSTVGSIGMITEVRTTLCRGFSHTCVCITLLFRFQLLGMNAEALHHVVNGMLHFFERIGAGVGDLVAFITGAPQLDASGTELSLSSVCVLGVLQGVHLCVCVCASQVNRCRQRSRELCGKPR
jgi:hypothetical protein